MTPTRTLIVTGLLMNSLLAHAGSAAVLATGCRTNLKTGRYHCHAVPAVRVTTPLGSPANGRVALVTRVPVTARAATPAGVAVTRVVPAGVPMAAVPPVYGAQGCFVGKRGHTYTLMTDGRKRYGPC